MAGFRPLASMFTAKSARQSIWRTSRQSGKSTTIAAKGWLLAALLKYFKVLYTTPLFQQAKTFANQKLNDIKHESPHLQELFTGENTKDSWNEKIMNNGSLIRLVYVLTDVDRARGESADFLFCDEFQEMTEDILPVIGACLAASEPEVERNKYLYAVEQYTGTPRTTTNLIEEAWGASSQAEWVIPCRNQGCKEWNVPSITHDLLEMIGEEGPKCAYCGGPINPDDPKAHWLHAYPERQSQFAGYHVSHIILPMHSLPNKWLTLLNNKKRQPKAAFYNETLGEACDVGSKRLTVKDMKSACQLKIPDRATAVQKREEYETLVMGADWGGKGWAEGVSRTSYVILGKLRAKFEFHVLWHKIFDITNSIGDEIAEMDQAYADFGCDIFAYDMDADPAYTFLLERDTRIPAKWRIPIHYTHRRSQAPMMEPANTHPKAPPFYNLDRTKMFLLLFISIKSGLLLFPRWERFEEAAQDFLSLEDVWTSGRTPTLLIKRQAGRSDDCAQATNYAYAEMLYTLDGFKRIVQSEDLSLGALQAYASEQGVDAQ